MVSFAFWVGIGASLGLWRLSKSVPQRQRNTWVNIGLYVLVMVLVGSRVSYVLVNRSYFASHPLDALMLWEGGLTWPGAIAGLFLALIYLAVIYRSPRTGRVSVGWLADRLYPLLPPLAITAWLGCWQAGVAYGFRAPEGAWWGVPAVDENGEMLLRWPVQLAAALSLLFFFALLERRFKPLRPPGRLSGLALTGLLLHLVAVSLLRADPSPTWNGLRVDLWAAIIYLALYLTFLILSFLAIRIRRRLSQVSRPDASLSRL